MEEAPPSVLIQLTFQSGPANPRHKRGGEEKKGIGKERRKGRRSQEAVGDDIVSKINFHISCRILPFISRRRKPNQERKKENWRVHIVSRFYPFFLPQRSPIRDKAERETQRKRGGEEQQF